MSERFDAYYKWLGIPPSEQPPNHYRLLGVNLYEADSDVIANAADRQMVHVRSRRLGPHGADCERLLNELATARLVLLNPTERAKYDETLRANLAPTTPDILLPPPPVVQNRKPRRESTVTFGKTKLAAAVGIAVIVIACLLFMLAPRPAPQTAAIRTPTKSKTATPSQPTQQVETSQTPAEEPVESIVPARPSAETERMKDVAPTVEEPPPSTESPPAIPDTKAVSEVPPEPSERLANEPAVSEEKSLASLSDEQIATALGQVKAAFRAELERQKTPEESLSLAESLIASAIQPDVPVERRYALLVTATEVAASAGAVDCLNKAFTHLEATADRDQTAAKVAAFATISKAISKPEKHAGIIGYLEE
ncbi:MAG TPA: hypothetical protein VFQ26_06080, partial [Nitrospiraceae bacterium]|nr:hypothetical protein [Nitrospiraceae bacterium]